MPDLPPYPSEALFFHDCKSRFIRAGCDVSTLARSSEGPNLLICFHVAHEYHGGVSVCDQVVISSLSVRDWRGVCRISPSLRQTPPQSLTDREENYGLIAG